LQSTGVLWICGGYFNDFSTGVVNFYNDLFAFNVTSQLWLSVITYGIPKTRSNADTSILLGSSIYFFGGSVDSSYFYFNTLTQLALNVVELSYVNFQFNGVSQLRIGVSSDISIVPRIYSNGTFGERILWATGQELNLKVTLIGTSSTGAPVLYSLSLNSLADSSIYVGSINLQTNIGSSCKLFVLYKDTNIPGSPFTFSVSPATVSASLISVVGATPGTPLTVVQGALSVVALNAVDSYSNPINANSLNTSQLIISMVIIPDQGSSLTIFPTVSVSNGVLKLSYYAPYSGSFKLSILWNGTSIQNSPFNVNAISSAEVTTSTRSVAFYLGGVCLLLTIVCLVALVVVRGSAITRAASVSMLALTLVGETFLSIGLLLRGFWPSNEYCSASPWLVSIGFVTVLVTMLAKAYRIQAIFTSKSLQSVTISDATLVLGVMLAVLGVMVIHVTKYFVQPYSAAVLSLSTNALLTFTTCTSGSTNESIWSFVIYGYPALFLAYGVYIGWQTRNVPSHFNESPQIALIIFNTAFISVLVIAVSNGLSTSGPSAVFLIETIGLAFGIMVPLFVTFIPKMLHAKADLDDLAAATAASESALNRDNYSRKRNSTLHNKRRSLTNDSIELDAIKAALSRVNVPAEPTIVVQINLNIGTSDQMPNTNSSVVVLQSGKTSSLPASPMSPTLRYPSQPTSPSYPPAMQLDQATPSLQLTPMLANNQTKSDDFSSSTPSSPQPLSSPPPRSRRALSINRVPPPPPPPMSLEQGKANGTQS
jgi:hypothetical protein